MAKFTLLTCLFCCRASFKLVSVVSAVSVWSIDQNATSPELPHILKGDWRFTDGNYETISFNLPNPGIIETEGIQLYGDNVYVGVEFHENGDGEARHTIYSFAKSEFSV